MNPSKRGGARPRALLSPMPVVVFRRLGQAYKQLAGFLYSCRKLPKFLIPEHAAFRRNGGTEIPGGVVR